jgi:23S rRNA pseudouridine1911/1915/1917 synthase
MSPGASSFEVSGDQHRLRLDRYLLRVIPGVSRRAVDRMLRSALVRVDGHPRDAHYFVKRGDRIEVLESVLVAEEEPREILRTAHMIAVGKPPGISTNPSPGSSRSVLAWLEARIEGASPGVVHRLDRDTSGLVLFSLSPQGHRLLETAFMEHSIGKRYLALIPGRIRPHRGTIDRPLTREASGKMRTDPHGRPSRTAYETLFDSSTCSLLEVRPHSGRTHQIRVHLASVGHPIAGDPLYGDPRHTLGAPRLWLHASSLEMRIDLARLLACPERMESPLWEDLQTHLSALGFPSGMGGRSA